MSKVWPLFGSGFLSDFFIFLKVKVTGILYSSDAKMVSCVLSLSGNVVVVVLSGSFVLWCLYCDVYATAQKKNFWENKGNRWASFRSKVGSLCAKNIDGSWAMNAIQCYSIGPLMLNRYRMVWGALRSQTNIKFSKFTHSHLFLFISQTITY